ncbi:MAG: sugar-binding protein [Acidobacteriota bacterium]
MRPALALVAVLGCSSHEPPATTPPLCRALDASLQVGVTHGTIKIRDDSPVPAATTIALDAAKNEYEPFQIVVAGGAAGVSELQVGKAALVKNDDASVTLPVSAIRLYQEARYHVLYASSTEGASGAWPDPLIPDVDAYAGQPRNAFVHFDVPANVTRAVWVDVRVPADQPAGFYTGTFAVSGVGLAPTQITVKLRVRSFALPSTASLPSAFGFSADTVTRAHLGGQWCSDFPASQVNPLLASYARAALDHRITLMSPICGNPAADLGAFDAAQGSLYDGTAATELGGARAQSFRNPDVAGMPVLAQHFAAKGWHGLVDYSCDEPPRACDLASWPARAQAAHDAGIPNLVTTDLAYLTQQGWLDLVDIACPVAETMNDQARADWNTFLARGASKQLWWYQSCDSHGCGGCDASNATFDAVHGMPSYVIDSDARQNRAMEWLSFIYDMSGELYYETVMHLDAGLDWDSGLAYCDFGGNGDGALFYPGKPGDPRIGGPAGSDFPLESVRLKLIREGMEDYEYLKLYAQKFGRDAAVAKAKEVFADVFSTKAHPAELLYQVRKELADGIEGAQAVDPLDVPRAPGAVDLAGDLHEFAAATPVVVAAGAANATFRMVWDDDALYVAATVGDPDLRFAGSGHDGPLYDADAVEVMLDPQHTRTAMPTPDDRQLIASASGDIYDARGAGATGDPSFDLAGLASHAIAHGTFNDAAPDTGYQVAVRIPWASLGVTSVAAGAQLGVDLALDDLDASGLTYADWAAVIPFAQPSLWHTIRLAGSSCL